MHSKLHVERVADSRMNRNWINTHSMRYFSLLIFDMLSTSPQQFSVAARSNNIDRWWGRASGRRWYKLCFFISERTRKKREEDVNQQMTKFSLYWLVCLLFVQHHTGRQLTECCVKPSGETESFPVHFVLMAVGIVTKLFGYQEDRHEQRRVGECQHGEVNSGRTRSDIRPAMNQRRENSR